MVKYSEKQRELLRLWQRGELKRINILEGSVRSGKTWVTLVLWAFWVAAMPEGAAYLMVAKTLTSLRRNCLDLLEQLVGRKNFTYSLPKKEARLFGRLVYLEGVNDARAESKIRGMTLQGALCDELTLFTEDFFAMLLSRLSLPGAKLFGSTNPDNPSHWLMANYIKRREELDMLVMKFLIDDNPALDPEYVRQLKREYTGVFYDRFILGRWVAAEGLIYPGFANDPERYAIPRSELPEFAYITVGVDFGGNKSAHAFVAAGITGDWTPMALRSLRIPAAGMSVEQMLAQFLLFADGVERDYGPIDYVYPDCAEQAILNTMHQRTKYRIIGSVKGEIIDRIRAMDLLIASGRFRYVQGECGSLVDALSQAVWNGKKLTDERLDDGTSDIDTLDAWEYSWSAFIKNIIRGGPCFNC